MILLPPRPHVSARPVAARAWASMPGLTVDMARILSLPFLRPDATPDIDGLSRQHLNATAYARGERLLPDQARALATFDSVGALFAPIGVGRGKTLTAIRCEDITLNHPRPERRKKRILHLLPPHLVTQLLFRDLAHYRQMIPMQMDFHCLAGLPAKRRAAVASSGARGVYIMPYSFLSTEDGSDLIDAINPDMVVADEAHMLAGRASARVRRLLRHLAGRETLPSAVIMSGTVTAKKITDYAHLSLWALGEGTFLPRGAGDLEVWGSLLDSEGIPTPSARTELAPLLAWAREHFPGDKFLEGYDPDAFRHAYQLRMSSVPGVVVSGDADVGTALTIAPREVEKPENRPGWATLVSLWQRIEDLWETPNGDPIDHAIHKWRWLFELSAGFYNSLIWPSEETVARRRGVSLQVAGALLEASKKHLEMRGALAKELRRFHETNRDPRLDTPMSCGKFMYSFHEKGQVPPIVPACLFKAWREAHEFEATAKAPGGLAGPSGLIERDSVPVRVCDFKVANAVAWAKSLPAGTGGLIWTHNIELAEWIGEALKEAGVPSTARPTDEEVENPKLAAGKVMVLTTKAYCEGKNLQHFTEQLVVQWPRQARSAEQMLGRCHRTGQKADELTVYVDLTTEYDRLNFAACLNDSLYIHQSTSRQKMIYANYDPAPIIVPAQVLKQRGLEAVELSARAQQTLAEMARK